MNTNDELKDHAPGLYELRKKDGGMRIPEDYFNDFEARIFEQIDREGIRRNSAKPGMFATIFKGRYVMTAAAAVALLISAIWFIKQPQNAGASFSQTEELLPEDVSTYVLENTQEFDLEQLASIEDIDFNHNLSPEQSPSGTPLSAEPPINRAQEEDIKEILKDMSEEELESLING
jgi:hypothetical protein